MYTYDEIVSAKNEATGRLHDLESKCKDIIFVVFEKIVLKMNVPRNRIKLFDTEGNEHSPFEYMTIANKNSKGFYLDKKNECGFKVIFSIGDPVEEVSVDLKITNTNSVAIVDNAEVFSERSITDEIDMLVDDISLYVHHYFNKLYKYAED